MSDPKTPPATSPAVGNNNPENPWREILNPEEYRVLRQGGTEKPYTGQHLNETRPGRYTCRACEATLFESTTKFDSHCGWPAFYTPLAGDTVELLPDNSHGLTRTEVRCANCQSHLGHVFDDAPQTPTGQRYCINSVCLTFTPEPQKQPPQQ